MASIGVEQHLENLQKTLPEADFQAEVRRLATNAVRVSEKHEAYWKGLTKDFEWLDWDALVQTAKDEPAPQKSGPSPEAQQQVLEAMRQQMPSLKTQVQFNAFMASFEALRITLDGIFSGSIEQETQGRQALEQALDLAKKVTEVSNLLDETPEAAGSRAAQEFKNPPAQFGEFDVQKRLLLELEGLDSMSVLNEWYERTKPERDQVVSQSLRNVLLDSIRKKNLELKAAEEAE